MQIAIDGPAGAGKSTVAKQLAQILQIQYIDTGAMYRALAFVVDENSVSWDDEQAVSDLAKKSQITLCYDGDGNQCLIWNGKDVSDKIRTAHIAQGASAVSIFPCVRKALVQKQQELAYTHSVVMDGRDIGTVVLPNADYKFFITASAQVRAQRRMNEWREKGMDVVQTLEQVQQEIEQRDELDYTRAESPLQVAPDAYVIDTSDLTMQQVLENIFEIIKVDTKGDI